MYTCTGLTCHPPLYKAHLCWCSPSCAVHCVPAYRALTTVLRCLRKHGSQGGGRDTDRVVMPTDSVGAPRFSGLALSDFWGPSVGRTGIPWSPSTQPHARGMSSPGTPHLPGSAAAEEDCVCPIFSSSKPGYTRLPQTMFLFEQLLSAREKLRCKSVGFIAFSNCTK